ncbi:P60-like protein [Viridothelium virens]|uniref:Ribosome biogenesis protein NOP53 n=1 Tax=Viridothelium virens TaxID=1048519 RepID=A0A6A6GX19_VIRVR|nr:P60-like protein [Viridothelium virens]
MAEVLCAPAQHKQPSRKGKRAWRKNIDISEVNEGLEEVRDQLIQGGVVSEKAAADLFIADTEGDEVIQKSYFKTNKPLKSDEILAQRSSVPALDTRKRKSILTDGMIELRQKKLKGDYVKPKELERLRNIAYGGEKIQKDVINTTEQPSYDPWAPEGPVRDPQFSFLDKHKPKPVREPKTLRHAPLSLAANGKSFPAVQKPDAGRSYNPDFHDWSSLLEREGTKEVSAEEKRLNDAAIEAKRMARAQAIAAEPDLESAAEDSTWESEWEGIQSGPEDEEWMRQKRPERKTPAQRNKAIRRKEEERRLKHERKRKEKERQMERMKELIREARERDAKSKEVIKFEESVSSDGDEGEVELHKRMRFGNAKIPEASLEVVLADELQDSLRLLKPEGNLLRDRYRNLVLNGKLEARRAAQHKKPMRTATEKWSYKDWKIPK